MLTMARANGPMMHSHMESRPTNTTPPRGPLMPRAWRLLRGPLLIYGAWVVAVFLLQGRMLYLPALAGRGLSEADIREQAGLERLWLDHNTLDHNTLDHNTLDHNTLDHDTLDHDTLGHDTLGHGALDHGTPDGAERTEAWLLRSHASTDSAAARTLVCFFHGNAELIDQCLAEAAAWRERGFDVLLPEYRGYGRSGGLPSQRAIVADGDALLRRAVAITGAESLIFHGRSLGTGIAVQVASRHRDRTRALVLESPFRSVASFAWRYGVPEFIVRDPYRTDELLPSFRCPTLILHAPLDEVVPYAHGEALASLQPLAMLVPLEGSHNSGLSSTSAYWRAIDDLLHQAGGGAH